MRSRKGSNKQLYDQDYQTISAFKSLADMMGISIIVIHHLRKMTSEDPLDCLSGTTGLVGAADTGLILQRRAGTTVLYVRGRDIEEQELALKRESTGDWTLLGDAQIAIMSQERAAILKVFQTHKLQVLSLKFLSDATGRKKPSILYHITKLVESGLVSRVEEGKYILERTEPTERIERVERVERVEWSES
jgi:DNA-binding transcriptional ArsR family regulator